MSDFFQDDSAVGLENHHLYVLDDHPIGRVGDSTDEDSLLPNKGSLNVQAVVDIEAGKHSCFEGGVDDASDVALNFLGEESLGKDYSDRCALRIALTDGECEEPGGSLFDQSVFIVIHF